MTKLLILGAMLAGFHGHPRQPPVTTFTTMTVTYVGSAALVDRYAIRYFQLPGRDIRVNCFWDNGNRCLVKVCAVMFDAVVNGVTIPGPAIWAREIDVVNDGKVSTVENSAWFLNERCHP